MAFTDEMHIRLTQIATRDADDEPGIGSIIYVPAAGGGWQELAITVPGTANFQNIVGTNTGDTTVAYKQHYDDTNPANVSGSAAAPGTTVISARRDHVHLAAAGLFAPADADYLVGTANANLSAEIVVGTTPGGELGGTWGSPTVDIIHSGSSHRSFAFFMGGV